MGKCANFPATTIITGDLSKLVHNRPENIPERAALFEIQENVNNTK